MINSRAGGALGQPVETFAVPMWATKIAAGNVIIETTGLRPCTGIVLYDAITKTGSVGHFLYPEKEPDLVEPFLNLVKDQTPDVSRLRCWLGGSEPFDNTGQFDELFAENRNYTLGALAAIGVSKENTVINWSEVGQSVIMSLDCRIEECTIRPASPER